MNENTSALQKHLAPAALVVLVSFVFAGGFLFEQGFLPAISSPFASKLEGYAEKVIRACANKSYPPSCYDTEIPTLMDQGVTMEEAFAITTIVQNKVQGYYYCHVLGHNLSAKETAKDPSEWTDVVARCPTGMCSNGCLHGAAQERFREDSLTPEQVEALIPDLSAICEPNSGKHRNFTGLEQASCYHSLGHLAMYITAADIEASTAVCDRIAVKGERNYSQTCYEGAYMQIFQPLEPEDFALVAHIPAKTIPEAETFCDTFSGKRNAACHRESWPLYVDTLTDPEGLEHFCSLVPGASEVKLCYNAMFYVLTARFSFDETKVVSFCSSLTEDKRKAQCFANAASRELETDYRLIPKAIGICSAATDAGFGDRCYTELLFYSWFNFHQGSDAFNQLCAAMPEPYRTRCASGEGQKVRPSEQDL